MRSVIGVVALSSIVLLGGRLSAQSTSNATNAFGPRPALSLSAGVSQFDLSGTGTTNIVALRGEYPLVPALLVEGGMTIARPQQAFSDRGTLLMPELQLQLQLPKRVAPFIGLGTGFAHDGAVARYGGDSNRITFSGAWPKRRRYLGSMSGPKPNIPKLYSTPTSRRRSSTSRRFCAN